MGRAVSRVFVRVFSVTHQGIYRKEDEEKEEEKLTVFHGKEFTAHQFIVTAW